MTILKKIFIRMFKLYYRLYPDTLILTMPIDEDTDVQFVVNQYYEENGVKYHRRGMSLKRYDDINKCWIKV